jgi:hypothetical protein
LQLGQICLTTLSLLARRLFAIDPARCIGFERVAGHDVGFGMTAPAAFKGAALEAFVPGSDVNRYHPRLASGTTRTVDRQQLWIGLYPHRHDALSIAPACKFCLFGARPKVQM